MLIYTPLLLSISTSGAFFFRPMLLYFGLHVSRVGQSLASLSPFQEPLVVSVVLSLTSVACVASISLVASVTSVASITSVAS